MGLRDIVSLVKDGATGVREVAIVLLLTVLLVYPTGIVAWLDRSNLDKVGVLGISIEARKAAQASRAVSIDAANELRVVEERVRSAEARLAALSATLARPSEPGSTPGRTPAGAVEPADVGRLAAQVAAVRRELGQTRVATAEAQAKTRSAVVAQSRALEEVGGSVRREGWLWVGQIDPASGTLRDVGAPETVAAPATLDPDVLAGSAVRTVANTDLYRAPFDGLAQPSPIVGVVPAGTEVRVREARLVRFARTGLPRRDPDDRILWVRIGPE